MTVKYADIFSQTQRDVTRPFSALANLQDQIGTRWTKNLREDEFAAFGKKYFDQPALFVENCIAWKAIAGESPTDYQLEILTNLYENRREAVRAGHGAGKTGLASWATLHFVLTREAMGMDWKVLTTASAWRQLIHYLWPEIHKWARRINWHAVGRGEFIPKDELSTRRITLKHGAAFPVASNRSDLIEGAHADQLLYIFDESKSVPEETWISAEGAMVGDAWWLAISTPGAPLGKFYNIHQRKEGNQDWHVRHVKMEEALAAGRLSEQWITDRKLEWGENSSIYKNRVLGEFAEGEVDSLVPLSWIDAAFDRWREWNKNNTDDTISLKSDQLGVDVARGGGDMSVIAHRKGYTITLLQKYNLDDTMSLAGHVAPYLSVNRELNACVDIVGWGAGVYDRLSEQFGDRVHSFHPQEKTVFVDVTELWGFKDCYSAAWWNLREILDPANPRKLSEPARIPPDDKLKEELIAVTWKPMSDGKILVQSKEKTKDEIGRSPDSADAVVMAFWSPTALGIEYA